MDAPAAGLAARVRGKISAGAWLPFIRRLLTRDRSVGFSFDDGPAPQTTPALIALLRAYGAGATFFLPGERASAYPDLAGALVAAGHDVFPHGWRHIRYAAVAPGVLIADLERAEALLCRFRPTPSPYLVRLPYGSGHTTPGVHRALRAWKPDVQIAHWDCLTEDWTFADGCTDAAQLHAVCDAAAERTLARPDAAGSILLLHENPYKTSPHR